MQKYEKTIIAYCAAYCLTPFNAAGSVSQDDQWNNEAGVNDMSLTPASVVDIM